MSAQATLAILRDDIRTTGSQLPDSVAKTIAHYHKVRTDIAALGDVNNADPRLVTASVLAALDAGRDPATDKATTIALRRWQLGTDFGTRLLDAAAQQALDDLRAQDVVFIAALNEVFLGIVDRLRTSHETLATYGVQIGLRDPLGQVAHLGGHVVSARLSWTDAIAELKPIRRLYETIIGHAPSRTDFGDVSDDLRESILADPGWWQEREDLGDLLWGLLDTPTWTPGLASRAESDERLARLEGERPKPATVEAKAARHATVINLGAVS